MHKSLATEIIFLLFLICSKLQLDSKKLLIILFYLIEIDEINSSV